MQKIVPHLWFNTEAKEAAAFYVKAFKDSKITNTTVLHNTPGGDCDVISFVLSGYEFMAISAGPIFKLTPAISFMVNFDPSKDANARENLDALWNTLSEGGTVLMPIQEYPFSKRYGWIQDKFGVTWQLILTNPEGEERPFIVPSLMFANEASGKAEEATDFYISLFKDAKRGAMAKYAAGMEPHKEGTVMFTDFQLEKQWFAAMDSGYGHGFTFTEAISLIVQCEDQKEIDFLWEKLSAVTESEQCGWLKDKYGVSWQIVPANLNDLMYGATPEQLDRIMQAFMPMKKLDKAAIEKAYQGI